MHLLAPTDDDPFTVCNHRYSYCPRCDVYADEHAPACWSCGGRVTSEYLSFGNPSRGPDYAGTDAR